MSEWFESRWCLVKLAALVFVLSLVILFFTLLPADKARNGLKSALSGALSRSGLKVDAVRPDRSAL